MGALDIVAFNGLKFIAQAVREWLVAVGARMAFIEPGSPEENGYCESFDAACGTSS